MLASAFALRHWLSLHACGNQPRKLTPWVLFHPIFCFFGEKKTKRVTKAAGGLPESSCAAPGPRAGAGTSPSPHHPPPPQEPASWRTSRAQGGTTEQTARSNVPESSAAGIPARQPGPCNRRGHLASRSWLLPPRSTPQWSASTSERKEQSRRNHSPETRERQQAQHTGQS